MRDYENISEKLKNDIQNLNLGISLVRSSIKEQDEIDSTKISNKTKELLSMVYTSFQYLGQEYIPEQLDQEMLDCKASLRKASEKISDLELELGKKVSPADISHMSKLFEQSFKSALKSFGLYGACDVTFTSHSVNVKIKFIKSLYEKSYFADTQDEIEELKEKNKQHLETFMNNFDYRETKDNEKELPVLISERSIKSINRMLSENDLFFNILSIDTDQFGKHYDEITTIEFRQDLMNIYLMWDRSVYSGDD